MCQDSSAEGKAFIFFFEEDCHALHYFFYDVWTSAGGSPCFLNNFDYLEWKLVLILKGFFCFLCKFKVINKYNNITSKRLMAKSSQIFSVRLSALLIASDQIRIVHPDPNGSSVGLPR